MIPENINVNLDQNSKTLEQCLKEIYNFGFTTYQNICTGQTNDVYWGKLDWLAMILLIVVLGGLGIALLIAVLKFIFYLD